MEHGKNFNLITPSFRRGGFFGIEGGDQWWEDGARRPT